MSDPHPLPRTSGMLGLLSGYNQTRSYIPLSRSPALVLVIPAAIAVRAIAVVSTATVECLALAILLALFFAVLDGFVEAHASALP